MRHVLLLLLLTACTASACSSVRRAGSQHGSSTGNAGSGAAGASAAASGAAAADGGTSKGGMSGIVGTGGSSAGAGGAASMPSGRCPGAQPNAGSPCEQALSCTYGDYPLIECRTGANCADAGMGLRWFVTEGSCKSDARCPNAIPTDTCEFDVYPQVVCHYPDGTVCSGCAMCSDQCAPGSYCVPCKARPQGTRIWDCSPPPTTKPGCPMLIPNEGTGCDLSEGTVCYSRSCPGSQLTVTCAGGIWRWISAPCPPPGPPRVCASPDTPIATPSGSRAIASLRIGDLVYSKGTLGIVVVPIIRVGRTPVERHQVVRVELANGETLEISGGHPTADGRLFSELQSGDFLDGVLIVEAHTVAYTHPFTYDILPGSESGTYYAGGALIGSTLHR